MLRCSRSNSRWPQLEVECQVALQVECPVVLQVECLVALQVVTHSVAFKGISLITDLPRDLLPRDLLRHLRDPQLVVRLTQQTSDGEKRKEYEEELLVKMPVKCTKGKEELEFIQKETTYNHLWLLKIA